MSVPAALRGAPRAVLVVLALGAGLAAPARAGTLVIDLTKHLIGITTGFAGTSVVLFGATDRPGDIIAVIRGPDREMTVRRKSKVAGIWANTAAVTFVSVPSFYAVAATRPPGELLSRATAAQYQIGLDHLRFTPAEREPPGQARDFANALVRIRQREALFTKSVGKIKLLGERLFRTTIEFPSNVPTGAYQIDAYLVRDREIFAHQTARLTISEVGLNASIFDFAKRAPATYGVIAVLTALVAGWLAGVAFRRI